MIFSPEFSNGRISKNVELTVKFVLVKIIFSVKSASLARKQAKIVRARSQFLRQCWPIMNEDIQLLSNLSAW